MPIDISTLYKPLGRAGSLKWKETVEVRGCVASCVRSDASIKGRDGSNAKLKTLLVSGRYKF